MKQSGKKARPGSDGPNQKQSSTTKEGFLQRHSLGLAAVGVVSALIVLYSRANPDTHLGSFFGNAIADWTGVCVTIFATKHLYERGSQESKRPKGKVGTGAVEFLREHSLTIFLVISGAAWVALFAHVSPNSRWGEVVGNLVSEWTQILGLVWLTKHLIEVGSKESSDE
jgi:hypothetical protein